MTPTFGTYVRHASARRRSRGIFVGAAPRASSARQGECGADRGYVRRGLRIWGVERGGGGAKGGGGMEIAVCFSHVNG